MSVLLKLYHSAIFICGTQWTIFPIVNRVFGEEDVFTGYIPFDTSSYVAQDPDTNLRYNLEQLANLDDSDSKINAKRQNKQAYKDDDEGLMQRTLVRCVEHHKCIVWFVKVIESIFSEAMVLQFLVMVWVICMTVYKIASLSILSAEFVSMAVYLGFMLVQLFIYCYFGTQLKVESEFLNQSDYSTDWLSLSPRFRRQILVMMQYCYNPISPQTAYIVLMSLDTYIQVLKSSYTLFTFLNR